MIVYYVKEASAEVDYYVVGSMTDWGVLETFKMEVNPDNSPVTIPLVEVFHLD